MHRFIHCPLARCVNWLNLIGLTLILSFLLSLPHMSVWSHHACFIPATLYSTAVSCGQPSTPSHGTRTGNTFTFGSVVSFRCEHGYYLQGDESITCQANKNWSGNSQTRCTGQTFMPFYSSFAAIENFVGRWYISF